MLEILVLGSGGGPRTDFQQQWKVTQLQGPVALGRTESHPGWQCLSQTGSSTQLSPGTSPQVSLPSHGSEHALAAPGLGLPVTLALITHPGLDGEGRTSHRHAKPDPLGSGRGGGLVFQELGARRGAGKGRLPGLRRWGAEGKARGARAGSRAAPASLPLHRPHRVADERPPLHSAELLRGGATQALPAPARRQHSRHQRDGGPGVATPAAGLHLRGAPLRSAPRPPPGSRDAAGAAKPPAHVFYSAAASAIQSIQCPPAGLPPAGNGPCSSPTPALQEAPQRRAGAGAAGQRRNVRLDPGGRAPTRGGTPR